MKRRNGEFCGKYRRPLKKSKLIGEGFYGSTLLYFKFLMVWSLVLLADFILEFRFEYLWPFWLLLRSVYDSVKYQGLAFSVFFVFIALTSDMICFLFIPVHWLFFAASTYVWVQYVWHTEKGICLSTISLWLLFVYIEASIRLKELKSLPFHLDLCRPFAAHCIGYFVVTLGFDFKSYVSYKMRLRKQREVAKENEFFIELLQQSLPQESCSISSSSAEDVKVISNGLGHHPTSNHQTSLSKKSSLNSSEKSSILNQSSHFSKLKYEYDHKKLNSNGIDKHELQYMEHQIMKRISTVNDFEDDCNHKNSFKNLSASISNKPTSNSSNHVASNCLINANSISSSVSTNSTNKKTKNILANNLNSQKDEHALRLEADMKKLKADLQASRQCESDLKGQINLLLSGERNLKAEVLQSQQDNENLQTKLHNLVTARQQDKQTIAQLEKKLNEEKKSRINIETQLATERKAKKAEEAVVMATAVRPECSDICKNKKRELENDIKQMKRELKIKEDQLRQIDIEAQSLRQYKDSHGDTEILMSALSAMQEKNAHLEKSLSAETRLKLDLFSALGDTKRQLGINQALLIKKDKEIDELKSKIAEMMAVMPETSSFTGLDNSLVSSMLYNSKYITDQAGSNESAVSKSTLDPNASVYSPKASDL